MMLRGFVLRRYVVTNLKEVLEGKMLFGVSISEWISVGDVLT